MRPKRLLLFGEKKSDAGYKARHRSFLHKIQSFFGGTEALIVNLEVEIFVDHFGALLCAKRREGAVVGGWKKV